ncbi:MAG TPA: SIS domain-containing protein [Oligoflexia bacterium]|nr:SIS domain-containing protein [Oligoflexia bacterium]HMP48325.1 SIS domain-containing protein [Oligoflexia bacterium]
MNRSDRASEILEMEISALNKLRGMLLNDETAISSFNSVIDALLGLNGKIVTIGIGKAGYIARKAASTFCTTGSPSVFLHPGDASHGDVGILGKDDAVLAFSNSGKNREVLETVSFGRKLGASLIISITSSITSPLAEMSDHILCLGKLEEACPLGFTPTSSTTGMLALADAIALVLMEERGFDHEAFSLRHHGGYLGEKSRREQARIK